MLKYCMQKTERDIAGNVEILRHLVIGMFNLTWKQMFRVMKNSIFSVYSA